MKKVINLVVTGGPCGGKTTALGELSSFFRSEGYTVYIVNETATELINDGMRPFGDNKLEVLDFQQLILKSQIAKESIRQLAAEKSKNDKVVIIYDRGILDNRAFVNEDDFQKLLSIEGIKEAEILARYDLVIHMVTCAIGKEEYYTTLNNTARTETVEQAKEIDRRIMDAWRNHMNQVIIKNDCLFEEKMQKVKNAIRLFLGGNEVIEQQRYLIKIGEFDFENLKNMNLVTEEIEEFVKQYDDEEDEMFCKSTIEGASYYTCVKNTFMSNGEIIRSCRNIGEREYYDNMDIAKSRPISKTRYNVIYDDERYRVDFYLLGERKFIIVERDVTDKSKQELPDFIKNAVDITHDRNYNDDSICIDYSIESIMNMGDVHK